MLFSKTVVGKTTVSNTLVNPFLSIKDLIDFLEEHPSTFVFSSQKQSLPSYEPP